MTTRLLSADPTWLGTPPFSHATAFADGTVGAKLKRFVVVTDAPYSASGDGVTDDRAAIQSAIDAVNAAGGGVVAFPRGTYIVGTAGSNIGLQIKTGVFLWGVGTASVIKLKDAADSHLINIAEGVSNCGIRCLKLDGNRANQTTTVHGLRIAGVDGFTAENLYITGAYHYGIGIQGGTNKRVKLDKIFITDTGGDGIDIKNKNDDNEDVQLSNVTVTSWGNNGSLTVQAAIDCRGPVRANNIWIGTPVASDAVGYRFRQGELLDTNGFGAHRSSLTNFDIRMGAGATQLGINVVARDVTIGQGYVNGGFRGISVQDSGFLATGVTAEGASGDGWLFDLAGSGLDADKSVVTGCSSINNGQDGFDVEADSVELIGCNANGNSAWGIRIQATATNTRVIGGNLTGNTSGPLTNAGTDTVVRNAVGYVSENYVESGSLTLDSTGTKAATIAHGLNGTPDLKKCSLTLIRETAVTDPVFGWWWLETADSTNISIRARVTTASATVGATFRMGVVVRI